MRKEKEKKKSECYQAVYEPMLNLEVRLYFWEDGMQPYDELLQEASWHWLQRYEVWNTITEPIQDDKWCFRALRVYDREDYRYLMHEIYHLVCAIRETYDLCEESWAYLIGWIVNEFIK